MKLVRYMTALVAAGILFTGCESSRPEALMAPNADVITTVSGTVSATVAKTKNVRRANRAEALITPLGGSVAVGGHVLKVPANAVSQATWFSVQVVEANAYHLKFKAWRAIDGAAVTQFNRVPLEMTFDVSDLENPDLTGLVVVYLQDGTTTGAKEKIATRVDGSNMTVTGYLTHFSSYAIAREYSMGVD